MAPPTEVALPKSQQNARKEAEQAIVLPDVSWKTYEQLLADFAESHAAHFAYDRGILEIVVLSYKREALNRILATLVEVVAEELEIDIVNAGSATCKRKDLARGFESDTSFYIRNAERMRGKNEIDLIVDPAPDLVIEVDLSTSSLDKMPIYAALGVPEIWRYDGKKLQILELRDGAYSERSASIAFANLTGRVISRFIEAGVSTKRTVWLSSLRGWVRAHIPRSPE